MKKSEAKNKISKLRETKIQENIMKYLLKQEWPSTSEDVAKGTGVNWNTAQIHLMKLQMKEKVKFRKVGRQNQWWLSNKYRREME